MNTEPPREPDHWLTRPETIRILWIAGLAVLAILVVLDLVIEKHPYVEAGGLTLFNAWFGFLAPIALVFVAKGLGVFFKRKDTYYDD